MLSDEQLRDELAALAGQDPIDVVGARRRVQLEARRRVGRTRPLELALILFILVGMTSLALVARSGRSAVEQTSPGLTATTGEPSSLRVTVSPNQGLKDGDVLTVAVSPNAPIAAISVQVCRNGGEHEAVPSGDQCFAPPTAGANPATFRVHRQLLLARGGSIDCASIDAACVVVARSANGAEDSVVGSVPLHFAATTDPVPAVSSSQTNQLHDGQSVIVTGQHFPAGYRLEVGQCAPASTCPTAPVEVTTDSTGNFEVTVVVHYALPPNNKPCRQDCVLVIMPKQMNPPLQVLDIPIEMAQP